MRPAIDDICEYMLCDVFSVAVYIECCGLAGRACVHLVRIHVCIIQQILFCIPKTLPCSGGRRPERLIYTT